MGLDGQGGPMRGDLPGRVHLALSRCAAKQAGSQVCLVDGLWHLQEAGIPAKFAPSIGIAVDHRRKNRSLEGLQVRACGPAQRRAGLYR